jgi:hypothetical protein
MKNSTVEFIYFTLIQLTILLLVMVYCKLWKEKHQHRVKSVSTSPLLIGIGELVTEQ